MGPRKGLFNDKDPVGPGSKSQTMRCKMDQVFLTSWEIMTQNITIVSLDIDINYVVVAVLVVLVWIDTRP